MKAYGDDGVCSDNNLQRVNTTAALQIQDTIQLVWREYCVLRKTGASVLNKSTDRLSWQSIGSHPAFLLSKQLKLCLTSLVCSPLLLLPADYEYL